MRILKFIEIQEFVCIDELESDRADVWTQAIWLPRLLHRQNLKEVFVDC